MFQLSSKSMFSIWETVVTIHHFAWGQPPDCSWVKVQYCSLVHRKPMLIILLRHFLPQAHFLVTIGYILIINLPQPFNYNIPHWSSKKVRSWSQKKNSCLSSANVTKRNKIYKQIKPETMAKIYNFPVAEVFKSQTIHLPLCNPLLFPCQYQCTLSPT